MSMNAPTIFSRILLVTASVSVVGLTYWFIATSLAPVSVPPTPTDHGTVRFDPAADITKHEEFSGMRLLGPAEITPTALGRQNPFIPAPKASATSTTSTPALTSPAGAEATSTAASPGSPSHALPIRPQTGTSGTSGVPSSTSTPQTF